MQNLLVLAAEGGHEPNNAIIPHDFNEVIWGSLAFLIVMGLIIWKGGPAIRDMWNGRIDRLRGELDTAAAARAEAEAELAGVQQRIADADQEKARIRSDAQQAASGLTDQIAERARKDAIEIRERGTADADNSRAQAGADLQAELARVAVGAAEQVVQASLDAATQRDLVEDYIRQLGTTNTGSTV